MTRSWDRQDYESEESYARFLSYLEFGPQRSVLAAYRAATTAMGVAAGDAVANWLRISHRHLWKQRAHEYDLDMKRAASGQQGGGGDEPLQMAAGLLGEVYAALCEADLASLSREEVRRTLPTFSLLFRDLVQFQHKAKLQQARDEEARSAQEEGAGLHIDDFNALIQDRSFIDRSVESLRRTLGPLSGSTRLGLRFVLASLYVDEASARRLTDAFDLYCGQDPFAANPVAWWDKALAHAEARGTIEEVIAMALNDFGENQALQEAVRQYREGEKGEHGR